MQVQLGILHLAFSDMRNFVLHTGHSWSICANQLRGATSIIPSMMEVSISAELKLPREARAQSAWLSGNEAVARAAWEAGARVAAAYPGTPSTEIVESLSHYPEVYTEWSLNEKVALEVALGASMTGRRALAAMKHVGVNVASDTLMTMALTGVGAGLVLAVADDVACGSSQNEQDSRYWGRFGHVPILEPADASEAHALTRYGFELSERIRLPVILRMTTRVCHVKGSVTVAEPLRATQGRFEKDVKRWVMVPGNAKGRVALQHEREPGLRALAEACEWNRIETGDDRRLGFIVSGPPYLPLRESFPDAPVLKLAFSHPVPLALVREFASSVDKLLVVEETEPLLEQELRATGFAVHGKDVLPSHDELDADAIERAAAQLLGMVPTAKPLKALEVFARPPTLCSGCPHLGVFLALARMKNVIVSGDIGCYTLGAGKPWNALDCCISMGASLGIAQGLARGRTAEDKRPVVAVIGDSTFLHSGMQGLLNLVYHGGNVTVLLLDNRATAMTGGQENPGTGRSLGGDAAPRVDFAALAAALGVRKERIRVVDPYLLPAFYKVLREEVRAAEPSVIITSRPCVFAPDHVRGAALTVDSELCTGCGNCLDAGCPAITVARRATEAKPNGKIVELAFVQLESTACTGCGLCASTCGEAALVPAQGQA
jgi:indolepyruvate ferredoxin oxidoreductase, alpha subunit